jgi:hypothetical protein
MAAHYPNRYRYRDRDRFTLQFDIDSDTDFDFDEALANTNKSKMINGGRRDWRLPSTKQSKNVHFFELWDHCGTISFSWRRRAELNRGWGVFGWVILVRRLMSPQKID